jgi:hypothetical protein
MAKKKKSANKNSSTKSGPASIMAARVSSDDGNDDRPGSDDPNNDRPSSDDDDDDRAHS